MSPCRPQLRRESAQDLGDDFEHRGKLQLSLSVQNPPDLKIDLLSDTSSAHSPRSPCSAGSSKSSTKSSAANKNGIMLLGAPGDVTGLRRHSHHSRLSKRNISAPVTPLNRYFSDFLKLHFFSILFSNRSTNNVNATSNLEMCRSRSRDTYLSVPGHKRERGTSLSEEGPKGGTEPDLYRLRSFTVSNKKIISHTESLQLRSNHSVNSSVSRYHFESFILLIF